MISLWYGSIPLTVLLVWLVFTDAEITPSVRCIASSRPAGSGPSCVASVFKTRSRSSSSSSRSCPGTRGVPSVSVSVGSPVGLLLVTESMPVGLDGIDWIAPLATFPSDPPSIARTFASTALFPLWSVTVSVVSYWIGVSVTVSTIAPLGMV